MSQHAIELTPEQHEAIADIAYRFGLESEDVIAWAVVLLRRYVDAGGEP